MKNMEHNKKEMVDCPMCKGDGCPVCNMTGKMTQEEADEMSSTMGHDNEEEE